MAQVVLWPFWQVFDNNGNPAAGAKASFFLAGTSTPVNVFSNSTLTTPHAVPVVADSQGRFPTIYSASGLYKIKLTDSANVDLAPEVDNWTILTDLTTTQLSFPTVTKTTDYTVLAADRGKVLEFDAAGATIIVTLKAATLGAGFPIWIVNSGATGIVQIEFDPGETLLDAATYQLVAKHQSVGVTSRGAAGWRLFTETTPAASDTVSGHVELATTAETIAGTDATRAVTPTGLAAVLALSAAAYPPGLIFGLTMSNAADTVNDIIVAAGKARDEADSGNIVLAAPITKRLDATWAVGDNQGGLNTGAEATSTWYEVHLIKRVDTSVVDVMFTTTGNRATLPTNYTLQRRIGWVRNDGSGNILQFTQVGDRFTWTTQVNDVNGATVTATAAAVTLTVPPSAVARFRAAMVLGGGVAAAGDILTMVFSEIAEGNVTPSQATGIASLSSQYYGSLVGAAAVNHFELLASSISTIEHDAVATGAANGTFDISTFGFIDTRLRFG